MKDKWKEGKELKLLKGGEFSHHTHFSYHGADYDGGPKVGANVC